MNMHILRVPLLILCGFSALILLFVKPRVHEHSAMPKQAESVKLTSTAR